MPAQRSSGGDGDTAMEDAPAGSLSPRTSLAQGHDDDDDAHADADYQTTVTDFLDFTEYLPSDMVRSLTLIGDLDDRYADASGRVHRLTAAWGTLPSLPAGAADRPAPAKLRADISEQLGRAVDSRVFAHAEAVRMADNVDRHYLKAQVLLSKLRSMMDNYPAAEELASQQQPRSPVAVAKSAPKGHERKKPKIPKITVPGEVLAPYDIEYDTFSDGSLESSEEDDEVAAAPATNRRVPAAAAAAPATPAAAAAASTPRIKIVGAARPPKSTGPSGPAARTPKAAPATPVPTSEELAAHAAALLRPPPDNAVVGSTDAPWLQLTEYELAKLRKRMKKNATWTPSETMVARELRELGRGPEDYREAKRRAEDEGRKFEPVTPAPVHAEDGSGAHHLPAGAISADSATAEDMLPTSNRGMKLNEAKKMKREALAKLAAEEAEESARKMAAAAKLFLGGGSAGSAPGSSSTSPSDNHGSSRRAPSRRPRNGSSANTSTVASNKRKRGDGVDASDAASETLDTGGVDTPSARPPVKRTKTETPVPPPQLGSMPPSAPAETPVPLPMSVRPSPTTTTAAAATTTTTTTTSVPTKPPMTETPVPLPRSDRRKSATPAAPTPVPAVTPVPAPTPKRETRGEAARRTSFNTPQVPPPPETPAQEEDTAAPAAAATAAAAAPPSTRSLRRSSSRGPAAAEQQQQQQRRPTSSRGTNKALSLEPPDRARRSSTAARQTPEAAAAAAPRPPSRRSKRPAPGVVSTTSSGGSAAVGRRKAAPKRKARRGRGGKTAVGKVVEQAEEEEEEEEEELVDVDDEGNMIDPDEERYCLCNRVSFGTMISCDNVEVSSLSTARVHDTLQLGPWAFYSSGPGLDPGLCPGLNPSTLVYMLTDRQCKLEWFHIECVGLDSIPARTTKWYCPDCRKALNIGAKGEVSARGVRK